MATFSPLSLEKLCINKILTMHWHDDFEKIEAISIIIKSPYWHEEFLKRHSILKWCTSQQRNHYDTAYLRNFFM